MGNRLFKDQRNPHEVITENQLRREFGEKLLENEEMDGITFEQYIRNCMESCDGTLSEVIQPKEEPKTTYTFMIRETLTQHVRVNAESFEAAQEEVERLYYEGEYELDRNCFDGAEFRPCCSCCESDFDDDYDLREVDDGTPEARMICDRCVADMEDSGEITRCEFCGDVFTPSRLKVNPENGEREICPICGNVWCD